VTLLIPVAAAIIAATTASDSLDVPEAAPEDQVPTYYASEVVVVGERAKRFELFSTDYGIINGGPIRELDWTPHVPVSNYGTTAYPSVRGLPVEHVAVEYDGVPLNSVQNGTFDLPILGVLGARGTVTRGPFSRLGVGQPAQGAISLGPSIPKGLTIAGGVGTFEDFYRIGYGGDEISWKVGTISRDAYRPSTASLGWCGEFRYVTPIVDASITAVDLERGVPGPTYDPDFSGSMKDRLRLMRFGFPKLGPAEATLYWTYAKQNYEDTYNAPTHKTYATGAIVGYDFEHVGLAGADLTLSYDHSELESMDLKNPDLGQHSRGSGAAVVSWVGEMEMFSIAAEAAGEHTSDFGGALSGALGAAYQQDIWNAWLSIGSSYRAPTMNELYWPEDVWTAGNPNLEPERVVTAEAGAKLRSGPWSAALAYYSSTASDLIVWTSGDDWIWRPANVDDVELSGWEVDLGADFGTFAVGYAGDFGNVKNVTTGKVPPYRPDTQSYLWWRTRWDHFRAELRLRNVGSAWVDAANTETIGAYTVADVWASLDLPWKGVALNVEARNLLDQAYETRKGYPLPGQEWTVALVFESGPGQ